MRCCETCGHWDRDGRTAALPGGFRHCLCDMTRGVPVPKAPDAGQWCEWHTPRPTGEGGGGGAAASPSRDAA